MKDHLATLDPLKMILRFAQDDTWFIPLDNKGIHSGVYLAIRGAREEVEEEVESWLREIAMLR